MLRNFQSNVLPGLFLAVSILFPLSAVSSTSANLKEIANDPYWLTLLHMESQVGGDYRSFVDDRKFFLSPEGGSNPYAELRATFEQFKQVPETRCRFIARWQWLKKIAPEHLPSSDPACSEYRQWREKMNTHKVVLVFASSYLNSPSSMYGHTFLRLDAPDMENHSPLLSYALNFGATVNESDNGMLYAFRGLVGGYPGQFSAQPYYEKVKEYSRLDNRDLWEYQLNLDDKEIDRMLAHIWELNFINFDYYFFDENCSLRLLELLDVARPGYKLGEQFPIVAVPIDTVRAVMDAGMIDSVHYRASNATRQTLQNDSLNAQARQLTRGLVEDESVLLSDAYLAQSVSQRKSMVEVAYSHLRGKQDKRVGRDKAIAKRRYALLKERHALAAQETAQEASQADAIPVPVAPEQGHKTSVWGVRLGEVDGNAFADIDARIAYHDILDNLSGYASSSTLAMGRVVVRAEESESTSLEAFELINIMSLSPGDQLHQPLSWQVDSGGRRLRVGDDNAWMTYINGGAGHTYRLNDAINGYGLIRAQIEYSDLYADHWDMAAGATLGLLLQNDRHTMNLEITHWEFSTSRDRQEAKLGYQFALGKDQGVRLEWLHRDEDGARYNDFSVAVRQYF